MIETLLVILLLLVVVGTIGLRNLLIKVEKYEDVIKEYQTGLEKLELTILGNLENVKNLDEKGHFQADDELGTFFKAMKDSSEIIANVYTSIENLNAKEAPKG